MKAPSSSIIEYLPEHAGNGRCTFVLVSDEPPAVVAAFPHDADRSELVKMAEVVRSLPPTYPVTEILTYLDERLAVA